MSTENPIPSAKKIKTKTIALLGLAGAVLALVWWFWPESSTLSRPETQPSTAVVRVTAEKMFEDYAFNPVRADQEYKNRWLRLDNLVVEAISQDESGPYLTLRSYGPDVLAYLRDGSMAEAASLNPGDNGYIVCIGNGFRAFGGYLQFRNCSFEKTEIGGPSGSSVTAPPINAEE